MEKLEELASIETWYFDNDWLVMAREQVGVVVSVQFQIRGAPIAGIQFGMWEPSGKVINFEETSHSGLMRSAFILCDTVEEAEAACPWAPLIEEVAGGFLCFESATDHATWLAKR